MILYPCSNCGGLIDFSASANTHTCINPPQPRAFDHRNPYEPVLFGRAKVPPWIVLYHYAAGGWGYTSAPTVTAAKAPPPHPAHPACLFGAAQTPTSNDGNET